MTTKSRMEENFKVRPQTCLTGKTNSVFLSVPLVRVDQQVDPEH